MKKFFSDFKNFALKGNVIDLAIGVTIGGAFGKIVTSLVNDIITPLIGLLTGGGTLADLKYVFEKAQLDEAGVEIVPENALLYGSFLQNIIDFLIIAFSIFVVLKIFMGAKEKMEKLRAKEKETVEEIPAETELSLLQEIRDLMKEKE